MNVETAVGHLEAFIAGGDELGMVPETDALIALGHLAGMATLGEQPRSAYTLLKAESTFCAFCGRLVDLLSAAMTDPAFYICFPCRVVGQVAVGPVERVAEEDEEEL